MNVAPGSGSNRLVVASFVLVFVVATVTFGYTWQGQMAFIQRDDVTATATSAEVTSVDEGTVTVRIRVHNPTSKPVRIQGGSIFGRLDGEDVIREGTGAVPDERVPAGGSRTMTVECTFVDRDPDQETIDRIRNGDLRVVGLLSVRMVDKRFDVEVSP
jgi:hypothetical protein